MPMDQPQAEDHSTPARGVDRKGVTVRRASGEAKRKPPIGTSWRILAGGVAREPRLDLRSADYPGDGTQSQRVPRLTPTGKPKRTTFDELVISGVLHVEQMSAREWWVGIGNGEMFILTVGRDGKVKRGEIYR